MILCIGFKPVNIQAKVVLQHPTTYVAIAAPLRALCKNSALWQRGQLLAQTLSTRVLLLGRLT